MNRLIVFFLFLSSICLMGCPYESTVALDSTPQYKIIPDLLGTWRAENYPTDQTEIIFTQKSETTYGIKATLQNDDGKYETTSYTAFWSKVNNGWLLNVHDNSEDKYYIVATELSGDKLNIKPLSEDITSDDFETSEEFRAFVENLFNTTTDGLYDDDSKIENLQKVH